MPGLDKRALNPYDQQGRRGDVCAAPALTPPSPLPTQRPLGVETTPRCPGTITAGIPSS